MIIRNTNEGHLKQRDFFKNEKQSFFLLQIT
jgi:hypothetical protein